MKNDPQNQWFYGAKWLFIAFSILCISRFFYLLFVPSFYQSQPWYHFSDGATFVSGDFSKEMKMEAPPPSSNQKSEQKFAQNAQIHSLAQDYKAEKQKVNVLFQKHQTVLRYEEESGIVGERIWRVNVDILPEKFESLNEALTNIGKLTHRNIRKTDETRNFIYLNERIAALEKKLVAYKAINNSQASVDEKIQLIDKMAELESELERMKGSKIRYEGANGLCSVEFVLTEKWKANDESTWVTKFFWAVEWAFVSLLYVTFGCLIFGILLYFGLFLFNKMNQVKS